MNDYDKVMEEEWQYEEYREEQLVAEKHPLTIEEWREKNLCAGKTRRSSENCSS